MNRNFDFVFDNMRKIAKLMSSASGDFHVYRYETIVFDKAQWIRDLAKRLTVSLSDDNIVALLKEFDVIPPPADHENEHIRHVTPGDYKLKLSKQTVAFIEMEFRDVFDLLGYRRYISMNRDTPEYRNVLAQFCTDSGCVIAHMLSAQAYQATNYWAPHSYWLTAPERYARGEKVDALAIIPVLRFGNSIQQLANALHLAEKWGICRLIVDNHPFIRAGLVTAPGLTLENTFSVAEQYNGLAGHFYYWHNLLPNLPQPNDADFRQACDFIRTHVFDKSFFEPKIDLNAKDLVVHMRGGDIFSDTIPHDPQTRRLYLQPPLAFYTRAVEEEVSTGDLRQVIIVYEDEGNPCVTGLKRYCVSRGIPHFAHSGKLADDLAILINATKLAFSYGTFLWAASMLSTKLERLYWFEDNNYANRIWRTVGGAGFRFVD